MSEAPSGGGGSNVKTLLTRKIGPLPAWAYGVVVVLTVWAIYLWRQRGAAPESSVADDLGIGVGGEDVSGHLGDTGLDDQPGMGSGDGGETVEPTPVPKTNASWFAAALDFLTDSKFYDRTEATAALQKYLQGKSTSGLELAMVTVARSKFGSAPEGVADQPLPTDPSKPDPPKYAVYVPIAQGFRWDQFIVWLRKARPSQAAGVDFQKLYQLNPDFVKKNTYVDKYGVRRAKKGSVRIA